MATILHFGHDAPLFVSRRLLLEHAGHKVWSITETWMMDDISSPVDLLVLCHSLAEEQRRDAMGKAALRWPGIASLVLESTPAPLPQSRTETFSVLHGPASFIAAVHMQCAASHVPVGMAAGQIRR